MLHRPYVESDVPSPLNVYGRSKARMEARVLEILLAALGRAYRGVLWSLGQRELRHPHPRRCSGRAGNRRSRRRGHLANLRRRSGPRSARLLVDGETGVWHFANRGAITWAALARLAVRYARMDTGLVEGRPTHMLGLRARRPRYSVLGSERGALMPPLEDALQRYFLDRNGRQVRERVRERRRAPREIGVAVQ